MTAQTTHWLEYGEPIGGGDSQYVDATHRITYETGPNESHEDEVIYGRIPIELLDLIEGHEHQHEDGSLLLSALDNDERERIEQAFEHEES